MRKRVFEHPIIQDKVVLLETSKETGGAYTLLEVELQPKGGNSLHYHTGFAEQFTTVKGELGIQMGKQQFRLVEGETATVPVKELHRFYNPGEIPVTFLVKLVPGHEGFEQGIAIAYGLAKDGKVNKKGIPHKLDHMSLIITLTDTCLPGFFSLIQPIMKWRAKKAIKKGIDNDLKKQYC